MAAKPKLLNKVPNAVLGFTAAQDVSLTSGNQEISLLGYDGFFSKVNVGTLILAMLQARVADKLAAVLPVLSTATPGSVVRINPSTPKDGDLKTVKPQLAPTGEVLSGRYEVYVYVNNAWRLIFPRS